MRIFGYHIRKKIRQRVYSLINVILLVIGNIRIYYAETGDEIIAIAFTHLFCFALITMACDSLSSTRGWKKWFKRKHLNKK